MKKRTKNTIVTIVCLAVLLATATVIYAYDYYHAAGVEPYLADTATVTVSTIKEGYFFDGPGEEHALIFYPGAKVEETAYAPLMQLLAAQGTDCFLVEMPMRLAVLGMHKADRILAEYHYKEYYLAGHSLGGAMAADYMAKRPNDYAGLFLLAAYPSDDLTAVPFPVVFIYGENDGVLNRKKLERGYTLVPQDYQRVEIAGGNHAGFGSYGKQDGDGEAAIPAEEQWQITVDTILNTIES